MAAPPSFTVVSRATTPFAGQKPGTSGLRKKVKEFQQPHYVANFVQSTFDALPADKIRGCTLVVSGDGRYYSKEAIQIILGVAAANGVRRVWVGENGLLSTPAVSAIIRNKKGTDGEKAYGAFILTASHNAGGPDQDFGIKYNTDNGGPALEGLTDKIYKNTTKISEYKTAEGLPEASCCMCAAERETVGATEISGPTGPFEVVVFDSADDYVELMRTIFDFSAIKDFLTRPDFKFHFDGLSGVAGAYANKVFVHELGVPDDSLASCIPLEDFGGGHPDPNLTYAKNLVKVMGLSKEQPTTEPPDMGAACDGDADRNMILGNRFFVTPSDSVAIIAANAVGAIPYFKSGLKGVARSMPTSAALDVVAKGLDLKFFEVPTGWKFFGNLMDAGLCSICGEESFGTGKYSNIITSLLSWTVSVVSERLIRRFAGSDHIREKDGIWA
eukprot:SM000222S06968  [mRNA]  locus=s222:7:3491:- [translate_table: standard]